MRIASFALGVLLVAGAAAAQTQRSSYTRVEIMPLAVPFGTAVAAEFRQALVHNLVAELQKTNLFVQVVAPETPAADPNTLRLALSVTNFNPGDAGVRAGVGLGFGATRMKVLVRFLDSRSCAVIAQSHADGKVIGGWLGGDSLGATRGVAKDVARQAARLDRRVRLEAGTSCDPDDGVTAVGAADPPLRHDVARLIAEAERGDPVAQRNLALRYVLGDGVPKNEGRAVKWCIRAAEGGDPAAQAELAIRYEMGWGLPIDEAASVSWVQKAAARNDPDGLAMLGVRYERGMGVKQNSAEAVGYYRRAAETGHARVMCYLGDMHLWGRGTEQSASDAYRWHVAAVAAGDERCKPNAKLSSKGLSRDARATAEREGQELAKKYARSPQQ